MTSTARPPSYQLIPWTPVGQMSTWTPDNTYVGERALECGQACFVMVWRYTTGLWVPAAYMHDIMVGQGVTSPTPLSAMMDLLTLYETRGTLVRPSSQIELGNWVRESIAAGYCTIPLRYFLAPGASELHYVVTTGYTPTSIQIADPADGLMKAETDNVFWSMYEGSGLIIVQRRRMLGDH